MKKILDSLSKLKEDQLPFEPLGKWIRQFDFSTINYKEYLPKEISKTTYSRNILTLSPIECVILYWLPNQESAIHFHEGFWGYVAVLEGEAKDIQYKYQNGKLIEYLELDCLKGGIIEEQDGIIHKLVNASSEKPLITAHFYYPAIESFDGMQIYDIINKRLGILNGNATSASWDIPEEHFHEIKENAFEYIPIEKASSGSHRIHPVVPKPGKDYINQMLKDYYDEQAHVYDNFDTSHESRCAYTNAVNNLIANDINNNYSDISTYLALACGTGRREISIKKDTALEYDITGLDLSEEMCTIASERGLEMINGDWVHVNIPSEKKYDVATFLYAFGHLHCEKERIDVLQKIRTHLKTGGAIYLDVFNIHNTKEWGPKAYKIYKDRNLKYFGYEAGDVFYRKSGGKTTAYLHYFDKEEIKELLEKTGFEVTEIHQIGYAHNPGEITKDSTKGNLFIKAIAI